MNKITKHVVLLLAFMSILLTSINTYNFFTEPYIYYKSKLSSIRADGFFISNKVDKVDEEKINIFIYVKPYKEGDSVFEKMGLTKDDVVMIQYKNKSISEFSKFKEELLKDLNLMRINNLNKKYFVLNKESDIEGVYTQIDSTGIFGVTPGKDIFTVTVMPLLLLAIGSLLLLLRVADKDKDNREKEDNVKSINYKGILFVTASLILGGSSYLMGSDEGDNHYHTKYLNNEFKVVDG